MADRVLLRSIIADILIGLGAALIIIGGISFLTGYQISGSEINFTETLAGKSDTSLTYIPEKYMLDYSRPEIKEIQQEEKPAEEELLPGKPGEPSDDETEKSAQIEAQESAAGETSTDELSEPKLSEEDFSGQQLPEEITINIKKGMSTIEVAQLLSEKGLVDSEKFMKVIRTFDLGKKIKAGNYKFTDESEVVDIIMEIVIK